MITISYPSLENFAGLQALREAVANGDQGFLVNDLPSLPAGIQVDSKVSIGRIFMHALFLPFVLLLKQPL
jgi:hypothetical protein